MTHPQRADVLEEKVMVMHQPAKVGQAVADGHQQAHGSGDLGLDASLYLGQTGCFRQFRPIETSPSRITGHQAQDAADLIKVDVEAACEFEAAFLFAVDLSVNAIQSFASGRFSASDVTKVKGILSRINGKPNAVQETIQTNKVRMGPRIAWGQCGHKHRGPNVKPIPMLSFQTDIHS